MKNPKDKEERISNLKNMINNVKNIDIEDSLDEDDIQDVFEINEENEEDYEIVDANEMIKKLNEEEGINESDKESLVIDDEFIYDPNNNSNEQHLEENSQINEEFIIQTKLEDKELEENDNQQLNYEDNEYISEQFDNVVHAKVGKIPIMAIVATIIGIIFIIIAIYLSTQLSTRVIDNVVSGESTTGIVIIAILGLFLIFVGVYEIFGFKNPFEDLTKKMKNIEKPSKKIDFKKEDENETNRKNIEKNKIPLNREEYKIGEFGIENSKSISELDDIKHETVREFENNIKNVDEQDIEKEKIENTKLSKEEIEEREYQKAHLEGESIDDIFSDIEEIDDIPLVSVDSNEQIKDSSKKRNQ